MAKGLYLTPLHHRDNLARYEQLNNHMTSEKNTSQNNDMASTLQKKKKTKWLSFKWFKELIADLIAGFFT